MGSAEGLVQGAFVNFREQLLSGAYLALPLGLVAVILAPGYIIVGFVVMLFLNGNVTGLRCSPDWYRRRRSEFRSSSAALDVVKGEVRLTRLKLMAWWSLGLLCWPPVLVLILFKALYELFKRFYERTLQWWKNWRAARSSADFETQEEYA